MRLEVGARGVVLLTASVAVLVAAVGIVYATIPDNLGVIHGCYAKATGSLRVIDNSLSRCRVTEERLNWSVTGPQGPQGPGGPQGPEGPGTAAFAADSGLNPIPITQNTGVVSVTLPEGDYVFSGKLVVGDTSTANVIICSLFNAGTGGGPSILDTSYSPLLAAGSFATLPLVGSLSVNGNAAVNSVSIVCTRQNSNGSSAIGQFAHLNAVEVTLQ